MFLKPQVWVEYRNRTREHQSEHRSSYWLWASVLNFSDLTRTGVTHSPVHPTLQYEQTVKYYSLSFLFNINKLLNTRLLFLFNMNKLLNTRLSFLFNINKLLNTRLLFLLFYFNFCLLLNHCCIYSSMKQ